MRNILILAALLLSPAKQTKQESDADKLQQLAKADQGIAETAIVKGVTCSEYACRVSFVVKDEDGTNFQLAVFRFLQNNPELGSSFEFDDDRNDPKLTFFVVYKEKALE